VKCSASSSGSSFTFLPAHVYARPASVVCCDTLQAYTPKHADTQVLKEGLSPSKSNPFKNVVASVSSASSPCTEYYCVPLVKCFIAYFQHFCARCQNVRECIMSSGLRSISFCESAYLKKLMLC